MSSEELSWVDSWDLLQSSGVRNLSRSGSEATFSCFSGNHSHGDSTPSAGMNLNTSRFQCRSPACNLKGNAADFLAAFRGISRSEAMRDLEERYGGPEKSVAPGELEQHVARLRVQEEDDDEQRIGPTKEYYGAAYRRNWRHLAYAHSSLEYASYMFGRGFLVETLDDWEIGYDEHSERVTIPVLDVDGDLVGIKGRAWREEMNPRYLTLGHQLGEQLWHYPFNTYRKGQHVFGLNRLRPEFFKVVVCEGELNAIALDQMGINAVAVAGAEFSETQRQLIVSRFDEVTLYFDPDEAGRLGAEKVAGALSPDIVVKIVSGQQGDAARALETTASYGVESVKTWIDNALSYNEYKRTQLTYI